MRAIASFVSERRASGWRRRDSDRIFSMQRCRSGSRTDESFLVLVPTTHFEPSHTAKLLKMRRNYILKYIFRSIQALWHVLLFRCANKFERFYVLLAYIRQRPLFIPPSERRGHIAQSSYGHTPHLPRDSSMEKCKGFDTPNESHLPWLPLGDVDPDMDLLLLMCRFASLTTRPPPAPLSHSRVAPAKIRHEYYST